MAMGVAYEDALLRSIERMQGAQIGGNQEWVARQMNAAVENGRGLARAERLQPRAIDEFLASAPEGWGDASASPELLEADREFRMRISTDGFSAKEMQALSEAGLTTQQITDVQAVMSSNALPAEAASESPTASWVRARDTALASASAFDEYANDVEAEYTGLVPNPVAHDQSIEAATDDTTAVGLYTPIRTMLT